PRHAVVAQAVIGRRGDAGLHAQSAGCQLRQYGAAIPGDQAAFKHGGVSTQFVSSPSLVGSWGKFMRLLPLHTVLILSLSLAPRTVEK
ncbi:hypothetical protein HMPREF9080_02657, partial [Cardiobacterium valvarum F0432]